MKFSDRQIAKFISVHYAVAGGWEMDSLTNWVNWAIENGFLLMVGDGAKIFGLVIIRPVMHPHKMPNSLEYDREGDCYFVDVAIALSPKRSVLQTLAFAVLKRFGQRDKIAFQKNGIGPVFVVDAHMHRKRLLRVLKEA